VSLKDAIERQLKIPTSIKMGAPGSLEVQADGEPIFSKKKTGRLPSVDEVIRALQARQAHV